ncbi:WYL domain-containing protein, partial [Streptomyces lydicus]
KLTDAPVRRRPGVELADAWQQLRQQVEDRPAGVRVTARIRRERLDMAVRILGGALTGPPRTGDTDGDRDTTGDGDWAVLDLAFPVVRAVRQLLQFGDSLEVLGPPEARRMMADAAAAVTAVYAMDPPPA